MEVTLAVLADYANVTREGKVNILGIFNILYAKSFPVIHNTMQLVMSFEAHRSEEGEPKDLMVKLLDEDGQKILEMGGPFKVGKPKDPKEMIIKSNQMLVINNLQFNKPGNYVFSVLIGGDTKERVPLKVIELS